MQKYHRSAFSLIELSIVLIVIGFLVSGVIAGKKLIDSAQLASARSATKSSPVPQIEDLELWLDATNEDGVIYDSANNKVSQWSDINPQKDKKNHAIAFATKEPTYNKNGANNLPTIYFDGDNGLTTQKDKSTRIHSNFTVFVVFKAEAAIGTLVTENNSGVYGGANSEQKYLFFPPIITDVNYAGVGLSAGTNGIAVFEHDGNYLPGLAVHSGSEASKLNVTLLEYINKTPYLYVNNSQIDTDDSHLTSPKIPFMSYMIGLSNSNSYGTFTGNISEIIIYSRNLSNNEKEAINDYLMSKWRIN